MSRDRDRFVKVKSLTTSTTIATEDNDIAINDFEMIKRKRDRFRKHERMTSNVDYLSSLSKEIKEDLDDLM